MQDSDEQQLRAMLALTGPQGSMQLVGRCVGALYIMLDEGEVPLLCMFPQIFFYSVHGAGGPGHGRACYRSPGCACDRCGPKRPSCCHRGCRARRRRTGSLLCVCVYVCGGMRGDDVVAQAASPGSPLSFSRTCIHSRTDHCEATAQLTCTHHRQDRRDRLEAVSSGLRPAFEKLLEPGATAVPRQALADALQGDQALRQALGASAGNPSEDLDRVVAGLRREGGGTLANEPVSWGELLRLFEQVCGTDR